jgi:hypothetical protein
MLDTAERTTLQQLAREQLPGLYALARHLVGTDPGRRTWSRRRC